MTEVLSMQQEAGGAEVFVARIVPNLSCLSRGFSQNASNVRSAE
jgi:hypothetical protein